MLNDIKKTSFKYDHELKPQYIAKVRELGEYEGEPCVYIVMRENFHTRGRFRAMIPSLIEKWGNRLEIKKRVGSKYLHITQVQAKLV